MNSETEEDYVDGFVLPIARARLDAYRRLVEAVAAIWREHGALDYREYVGDAMTLDGTQSLADLVGARADEVVVFGWVAFASREARDHAHERVAADPRVAALMADAGVGFDAGRMGFGGFRPLVPAPTEAAPSYAAAIDVAAPPAAVYDALTRGVASWWTTLSSQAVRVGETLVVRFERETSWTLRVAEAAPSQALSWDVIEAHHDLDALGRADEWRGTRISWAIAETEAGSRVALTHRGLVPALDCYDICQAGWTHFLASLKAYLETGRGRPYRAGPSA